MTTSKSILFHDSKLRKLSKFKLFGEELSFDENDGLKFFSFMRER